MHYLEEKQCETVNKIEQYFGRGSSWMWSMRTSCRIQKRQRCCKDLTLQKRETGYSSCTGVGGSPVRQRPNNLYDHISPTLCSQVMVKTFSSLCDANFVIARTWHCIKFTRYTRSQKVKEFSILRMHDGTLYELHHRMAAVLKLWMAP